VYSSWMLAFVDFNAEDEMRTRNYSCRCVCPKSNFYHVIAVPTGRSMILSYIESTDETTIERNMSSPSCSSLQYKPRLHQTHTSIPDEQLVSVYTMSMSVSRLSRNFLILDK